MAPFARTEFPKMRRYLILPLLLLMFLAEVNGVAAHWLCGIGSAFVVARALYVLGCNYASMTAAPSPSIPRPCGRTTRACDAPPPPDTAAARSPSASATPRRWT